MARPPANRSPRNAPSRPRPGRKRPVQGVDLDAWLVSRTQFAAIVGVAVLAVAAGLGLLYLRSQGRPENRARSAINEAMDLRERALGSPELDEKRDSFNSGEQLLDQAQTALEGQSFDIARGAAEQAQGHFRRVITSSEAPEDGSFREIEGAVQLQRGGDGSWQSARVNLPLYDGDFVKTGQDGSAEILYATGSIQTVEADTIFAFKRQNDPRTNRMVNQWQMEKGTFHVRSGGEEEVVVTPQKTVVTWAPDTQGEITIDPASQRADIRVTQGQGATVTTITGESRTLAERQRVEEQADSSLSEIQAIPDAPVLTSPPDGRIYDLREVRKAELSWQPVSGIPRYLLQISRGRFFISPEVEDERSKTDASLEILHEGTYFWRVASISREGVRSEFSPTRRFKFRSGRSFTGPADDTLPTAPPPKLSVDPYQVLGSSLIFQGMTDPGATVTVDGEAASVDADGSWRMIYGLKKVGLNVIEIKASRGGAETSKTVPYNYVEN